MGGVAGAKEISEYIAILKEVLLIHDPWAICLGDAAIYAAEGSSALHDLSARGSADLFMNSWGVLRGDGRKPDAENQFHQAVY